MFLLFHVYDRLNELTLYFSLFVFWCVEMRMEGPEHLLLERNHFSSPVCTCRSVVSRVSHPTAWSPCAGTNANTEWSRGPGMAGVTCLTSLGRERRCLALRTLFFFLCESSVSSSVWFRFSLCLPAVSLHCHLSHRGSRCLAA